MDSLSFKLWAATQRWRQERWPGYLAAVVGPVVSVLVRVLIGDALVGYPFITFFPAVLLAALIGDRRAAAIATVLSAALASRYAIDADGDWLPASLSAYLGLAFFFVVCAIITILVQWLYESLNRLNAVSSELKTLNAELEQLVDARTNELAQANAKLLAEAKAKEAAEAQLRQAQKMQAIGQLTGGIAHDFNNMMAVVISGLDLAKRRIAQGDMDVIKYVDAATDGARRAASLTQRLLAFSRQAPLSPAITDINRLVKGMDELLRRSLGETISLELVSGGGLWVANVDAGQLENAVLNLAVNARDAMPNGGRLTIETLNAHLDDDYAARHVEVAAGQYVVLAVSDTGTGMPAEVIERAFEPFYTTKSPGQGTGLGLSQVHGFVKQSGGHVKIYSEPGHGTTVKLYFPRAAATKSIGEKSDVIEAPVPVGTVDELIVVVEDEVGVRRLTVDALRELGYTVRHAASGPEALKMLDSLGSVALMFTDVVMPGMSGRQLADTARAKWPHLKVLYTTGYTRNAIIHNGVVDGDAELLMKPFTVDQLARKVRKMLSQHA